MCTSARSFRVEVSLYSTCPPPAKFTGAPLMLISLESSVTILLITALATVKVPDTFRPSATCTAVESSLDIELVFITGSVAVPVAVTLFR